MLTRVRAALLADGRETPLEFASASATFQQNGWPVAEALKSGEARAEGEGEGGWAIAGRHGQRADGDVCAGETAGGAGGREAARDARMRKRTVAGARARFVPARRCGAQPSAAVRGAAEGAAALAATRAVDPAAWKPEDRAKVERHFLSTRSAEIAQLYKTLDEHRAALAALPVCDLPIMQELTGKDARKTQVFPSRQLDGQSRRGAAATPQILNRWHDEYPRNRLGFAKWLTNGENPLTARVQVNRVWEQLFGVGLVETLEDFGSQGDKPVYQDLLDELAVRFQSDMKWSQKALLREIVLSRVYRQSSKATQGADRARPGESPARARAALPPRQRANPRPGARARRHPEPQNVWPAGDAVSAAGHVAHAVRRRDWITSHGEDGAPPRDLHAHPPQRDVSEHVTFDAPNREFCVVRRIRTNTPLQSLDLLNSPVFMEAAAGLAKRMTEPGGTLGRATRARPRAHALQRPRAPG